MSTRDGRDRQPGVRVRADLSDVGGYTAGASAPGAVKLSSNESGFDPLPGVEEAIQRTASSLNRYPDNGATALREQLAARWGVRSDEVIVGCGSSLLCQELVQATCGPGDVVAFGWRSFEAYKLYARAAHAQSLTVPNRADGSLDLPALAAAIATSPRPVGIVFLCTPNNPTGALLGAEELASFLDAIPATIPVVVDEAYIEFADAGAPRAADLSRAGRENVVMLRTFSKAYGLAGLRVGYAIASPKLLEAVHAIRSPFSVTAAAQAAAIAALAAQDALEQRVSLIRSERARVISALSELAVPVRPSQANFVWLPLGSDSASFAEHCRQQGVLIRSFAPEGVRVSIATAAENDAFLSAASRWANRTSSALLTERKSS